MGTRGKWRRLRHTIILDDPFDDPPGLEVRTASSCRPLVRVGNVGSVCAVCAQLVLSLCGCPLCRRMTWVKWIEGHVG